MIDRAATRLLAPALRAIARPLVAAGIGADAVTLAGFAAGLAGAAAIAQAIRWPGSRSCSRAGSSTGSTALSRG